MEPGAQGRQKAGVKSTKLLRKSGSEYFFINAINNSSLTPFFSQAQSNRQEELVNTQTDPKSFDSDRHPNIGVTVSDI
jgi:hypothetical protein